MADQLVSYFDANPDLVTEVVALVRQPPASTASGREIRLKAGDVEYERLRLVGLELLTALAHDRSANMMEDGEEIGLVQREANVPLALGVGRGVRQRPILSMLQCKILPRSHKRVPVKGANQV